ncbi:MAG: hypothetical protein OXC03_07915 [Flavobacteriaceae bacterium]|nr:hypothetical protein [Flavobacteriaceae bacterium]
MIFYSPYQTTYESYPIENADQPLSSEMLGGDGKKIKKKTQSIRAAFLSLLKKTLKQLSEFMYFYVWGIVLSGI